MFADEKLMNLFVLKGGNALDIVHGIAGRASWDLDFSIETEFKKNELVSIQNRLSKSLSNTFREAGYKVFDVRLAERPKRISRELAGFWGGYRLEFKIIESDRYPEFAGNIDSLRRNAMALSETHKKNFLIEISKFEHCHPNEKRLLGGYTIQVYTPVMIVFEKLRAICQQTSDYAKEVKLHRRPRARDFFDIYSVFDNSKIKLTSNENKQLIVNIFKAKKVPLKLLGQLHQYREFHRPDFAAVEATVRADVDLKSFDFYFDFVVQKCDDLKTLWEK